MGAGTIGLLADARPAAAGLEVTVFGRGSQALPELRSARSTRGPLRLDGREPIVEGAHEYGPFDIIFEATGYSPIVFDSMQALGKNGVLVLSSVTGGDRR